MTTPASPEGVDRNHNVRLRNLREAARQAALMQRLAPVAEAARGRWTRRHWAHASLAATCAALLAALVPGFSNAMQVPSQAPLTTLSLALPPAPRVTPAAAAAGNWQLVTIEKGQTLGSVFEDHGIPATVMHRLLEQKGAREALVRMRPGTQIALDFATNANGSPGAFRALRYDRGDTQRVELAVKGDDVVETVIERPVEIRTAVVTGKVGGSLFHSARKLGLSGSTINALTDDIFKYDIDFNSDVTRNDRFSVVVEQVWREGELLRTGPVQAAVFTAKGKAFSAFRFERDGKGEYFTADGRPLKKSFIRMPISYARLSSKFGARRHPVLGTIRQHKGVDYAARTGTPIMAAGDARVQFAGWRGGYGRTVILDHGRGYTTLYAHMSGFGKIKQGQRVSQGTVIGQVGTSGLSTGPHLHYEFRINGVHRNPLQHTMPPAEPLSGTALAQFRAQTGPALDRIRTVENIVYAEPERRVAAADAKPAQRPGRG